MKKRGVVTEDATCSCCEKMFHAQIRSTVYHEPGRCPLREARERLPEKHKKSRSAIFLGGVRNGGCSRGVSLWERQLYASKIAGGAAFRTRYPANYLFFRDPKFRVRDGDSFACDGC